MSSTFRAGATGGASMEDLRADIAETGEDLGETVEAPADKADVKGRAKDKAAEMRETAKDTAVDMRVRAQDKAEQVGESMRRRPGRWAAAIAATAAAAAAVVGIQRWRQARRKPRNRSGRAWQKVTSKVTDRFGR